MLQPALTARTRQNKGKGAARKLRSENQIPAIFYGPGTEPIMLAVNYAELDRIIQRSTSDNIILDLKVQSESGVESRRAIIKDLQVDPTKDRFLHADFCEISMDKEITVDIPIHLVNTPVGVTKGGVLQHVRRELTISCLPDKIIDGLELDVANLEIGDSLHIRDLELPDGIRTQEEGHLTVAVVAAPAAAKEAAVTAEGEGAIEEAAAEETEES